MKLKIFSPSDDFFTDRLCRRYGAIIFVAVSIAIAFALASDTALKCWIPSHFTDSHIEHTHTICWNTGTFYKVFLESVSPQREYPEAPPFYLNKIKYLPVVLLMQVLIFFIPRVFWTILGYIGGLSTQNVVKAADNVAEDVNKDYSSLATLVTSYLQNPFPFLPFSLGGYVLSIQYIISKMGYLISTIVQMAILTAYLGFDFFTYRYGGSIWHRITNNISYAMDENTTLWEEIEPFPRTVLCDFSIRRLGNIQRYTVQCELTANETVERGLLVIWLFLWFSFFMLCVSTFGWVTRLIFYAIAPTSYRAARIAVLIGQTNQSRASTDKSVNEFKNLFLKPDGALIMEIIEDNVSINAACGVAKASWSQYISKHCDVTAPNNDAGQPSPRIYPELMPHGQAEIIPLVEPTK